MLISIICDSVDNAQEYLDGVLKSMFMSEVADFGLIFEDVSGPDRSPRICDEMR